MKKKEERLDELKEEISLFMKSRESITDAVKNKLIDEIKKQVSEFIEMHEGKDVEDEFGNLIIVDKNEIYKEDNDSFWITIEEGSSDDEEWSTELIGLTKDGYYQYVQMCSNIFGGDVTEPEYDRMSNLSIDALIEILHLFPLKVTTVSEEDEE